MTYHHTRDQLTQIERCRIRIERGATIHDLRRMGFAEAAIQAAYGRDPENVDPYGPNNPSVKEM